MFEFNGLAPFFVFFLLHQVRPQGDTNATVQHFLLYEPICQDSSLWEALADQFPDEGLCRSKRKTYESTVAKTNPKMFYAKMGEYPSLVMVRTELDLYNEKGDVRNYVQFCNGFLITKKHVLSSARCFQEPPAPPLNVTNRVIKVIIGEYNKNVRTKDCATDERGGNFCAPESSTITVDKILPHPAFDRFTFHNDIGLLQLSKEVEFSNILRPICLPRGCGWMKEAKRYHYYYMKNVGWNVFWPNKTEGAPEPSIVQKIKKVIDYTDDTYRCDQAYLWMDKRTQLCTLDVDLPSQDVNCDSWPGGPLVLELGERLYAIGISSFGESCRLGRNLPKGDPQVFTWLIPYMTWILKTIYFLNNGEEFRYTFSETPWPLGD